MNIKIKRFKSSLHIIVTACLLVIILIVLSIATYYSNIKKTEKRQQCQNAIEQFSYEISKRHQLISSYENLIVDSKYLTESQLSAVYGNLAVLYVMENDYEKAIDCAVYAANYSEISGELYMKAWSLNNMANIFLEMEAYDVAEEAFRQVLNVPLSVGQGKNLVREYAKLNLAEIYSRNGQDTKAEEILNMKTEFENMDEVNINMISMIRKVIHCRIDINKGNYKEAEQIISTIYMNENIEDEAWIKNILMSKIELEVDLFMSTGKYEEAHRKVHSYLEICDKYNYKIEKVRILTSLYKKCEKYGQTFPGEHKEFLLKTYPDMLKMRNKSSSEFIMYTHRRSAEYLENINKNINQNVILFLLFLLTILLISFLMIRLFKSNKSGKTDGLTYLNNRRNFDIMYKRYKKRKVKFGIIFIDIDHFKRINDVYGHEFGDIVLKKLAETLLKNMRKTDKAFRYGGEEFCILCKTGNKEEVLRLAERLRICVENLELGNDLNLTISAGVAHSNDKDDLISEADKNMYKSKNNGRNRVSG